MRKFFLFELKKNFINPKNLFIWAIILITLIGYVIMNMNLDRTTTSNKENEYRSGQWDSINGVNELLVLYEENGEVPEEIDEQLDFWRLNSRYISEQIVYSRWRGEDRYKDALMSSIKQDENMILGIDKGYVTQGINENLKLKRQSLENTIEFKKILYKKNIRELNSGYVMTAYHFLYKALTDLSPFLLTILVLLLSADCISNESESGSFKFLLIQPIHRTKVFLIKVLASIVHSLITLGSSLLLVFIGVGLFNGFGEADYPISYDPLAFSALFSKVSKNGTLHYLSISKYLLFALFLFVIYVIFLSIFSTFISSFMTNSLSSMSTTSAFALISYMLLRYLGHVTLLSVCIPFSYGDINKILNGQNQITALFSVLFLLILSILLIIIGSIFFQKKDIVC